MGTKLKISAGDRFNDWEIIKEVEQKFYGKKRRAFLCRCVHCGREKVKLLEVLRSGNAQMCQSCNNIKRWTTHGLSHNPLYFVFKDMHARCEKQNHKKYHLYGARGIKVCDMWEDTNEGLKAFVDWAESNGYKDGLQIDRIDNEKGYSPDNCRWVSISINNFNKRNTKGYGFYHCHWVAYITKDGKQYSITCNSEEEAIEARKKLEIEFYGENSQAYRDK